QPINVLGEHRSDFSGVFQLYNGMMHRIWPRGLKRGPSLKLVVPVLDTRRFRGHKILVVHRLATSPNAIWPPEIRDPAPGRNASTGKDHYPVRFSEVFDQIFQFGSHRTVAQRVRPQRLRWGDFRAESSIHQGEELFKDVRKIFRSFSTMSGDWRPYSALK